MTVSARLGKKKNLCIPNMANWRQKWVAAGRLCGRRCSVSWLTEDSLERCCIRRQLQACISSYWFLLLDPSCSRFLPVSCTQRAVRSDGHSWDPPHYWPTFWLHYVPAPRQLACLIYPFLRPSRQFFLEPARHSHLVNRACSCPLHNDPPQRRSITLRFITWTQKTSIYSLHFRFHKNTCIYIYFFNEKLLVCYYKLLLFFVAGKTVIRYL